MSQPGPMPGLHMNDFQTTRAWAYDWSVDLMPDRRGESEKYLMQGFQGMIMEMSDQLLRRMIEPLKKENERLWERIEELESRLDELEDE